jgi:hypothetical protein
MEFEAFNKIPRLSREVIVTEKIDGTNAQIFIGENGEFKTGSRNRWITPEDDNYGFAKWALENKEELLKLGPGRHFGEWYGQKIQHGYGGLVKEKRLALFNTSRWNETTKPICCDVVPVLYQGIFCTNEIQNIIEYLRSKGSRMVPGFMKPEGIIIYHVAANIYFKKTIEKDESRKGDHNAQMDT